MSVMVLDSDKLQPLIKEVKATDNTPEDLIRIEQVLNNFMPDLTFSHVLTRGNWHRLGGIVNKDYLPIADNIAQWSENECDGDVDEIILKHVNSGYFATRITGKTHFFTAAYGSNNDQFIQLEVEQLMEVLDRPLVDKDWFPDSLEEFIDPIDFPRLESEPIGQPWFRFRRISDIADVINNLSKTNRSLANLHRFLIDWHHSSANDSKHFCHYWVFALREYQDRDGEYRLSAKPISTYAEKLPELPPAEKLKGTALSKAIHDYDHQLGYPFAWFFSLLTNNASNFSLAEAVLRDQQGAYDYLPARDYKILSQWEEQSYAV